MEFPQHGFDCPPPPHVLYLDWLILPKDINKSCELTSLKLEECIIYDDEKVQGTMIR